MDSTKKPVRRVPRGRDFTVAVTREIMEHARQRDSSHCMIAQAVKDAIPEAASIAVDIQTIRFSLPAQRLRLTYLTPRIAQIAIVHWDQGKMPEPYDFKLRGAHVTAMYSKAVTPSSRVLTARQAQALAKAQANNPTHARSRGELGKARFRGMDQFRVAERVGGKPPPVVPGSRRRAFGLRGLEL